MSTSIKRPKARLPRGFRDRGADEVAAERHMIDTLSRVYESYGFAPLETPAFEYTDALGKFLPDVDRPNQGVFSLKDDDDRWLSLRYDLTAPLARYVAEHFQDLPKPFRRYQVGRVWRNEKPGPGRFREFTQFDADTVGSSSPAADAELLMMVCDALEALGLRGKYAIKINSRKFLNGILRLAEVDSVKTGAVLRALDKFDRLGETGVRALLGEGRKDESGDFTKGAGLTPPQITQIMRLFMDDADDLTKIEGFSDLRTIREILARGGYESDRIAIDLGIIRGLEYYTGPVFEAQLTFPVKNEDGEEVVFGSVAGGGRYDDLVARFTGQQVPATGISIGVSRLLTALRQRGLTGETKPLIVILSLDDQGKAFQTARELREQGFRAEAYVGTRKFGDQLKYADKRGAALAVIEGADERASGKITIKNLVAGAAISKSIESREEWLHARQAQVTVDRGELVKTVREMLAAHT
ncbi:MAG: histidine--tRNA ligase [Alphaproteobacteria bacterium]|nr:histidine--tRNA ligase [Alphaproteobacteria bacterium]MBV9693065.1 histidine--tRNA ligase [Alphaproteobacteria bacterium]